MHTPWGKSDSSEQFGRGISFVSTPSHGGFAIARGRWGCLTTAALQRGEVRGEYVFFEEDCAAYIVMLELPQTRGTATEADCLESLSYWYPEYLTERGITPNAEILARRKEWDARYLTGEVKQ